MIENYRIGFASRARPVPGGRDVVTLLAVGRLSSEKGFDVLLKAVAILVHRYPKLQLIIAGIGPTEGYLRSLAARLGIADRVRFVGYVENMQRLYSEVDLVVQSSFTEGLPNVMLEAAYLGVPVVATRVGGTREVIKDGVAGWLVEPRSVVSLVAGIRRYLEQPGAFLETEAEARNHIEENFSFAVRTEKQTLVYEECA